MLMKSKIKIGPESMFNNIHQAIFKSAHLLNKFVFVQFKGTGLYLPCIVNEGYERHHKP